MPLRPRTLLHELVDRLFVAEIASFYLFFAWLAAAPRLSKTAVGQAYDPREHFEWVLMLVGVWLVTSVIRTWLRGTIFPGELPDTVWFHQNNASGRSYRSWFTRLSGFNNGLEVTVTRDELRTRICWWFRWLYCGADFGLENRIPLSSITSVTGRGWWFWRRYLIGYRDATGRPQRLMLRVNNSEAFLVGLRVGNPALRISDD